MLCQMFTFCDLQAGVAKLNEAKALVAELNSKAGEQSRELAVKQKEADDALKKIQTSMAVRYINELSALKVYDWGILEVVQAKLKLKFKDFSKNTVGHVNLQWTNNGRVCSPLNH